MLFRSGFAQRLAPAVEDLAEGALGGAIAEKTLVVLQLDVEAVDVDGFNLELKDDEGFLGDRASKGAFRKIFDRWRKPLRKTGEDPFGKEPSDQISKKTLDAILIGDDTEASALVHSAIEDFAQQLAYVTRRFLKTKAWAKTERIMVGGGFRDSRLGELAIARTEIILKSEDFKIDM